ncbi:matrix metalloproteinase-16-like protein, partial [Leptotrombidium deliense]
MTMNFTYLYFILSVQAIIIQAHEDICDDPKIDAIVTGQRDNELYVFTGNLFWKYDYNKHALSTPKQINDIWVDVPTPIDAADVIKYFDQHYYMIFLKQNSYWMYESTESIEKQPKLVSTGDVGTQFDRRIEALQISPKIETHEEGIRIIASMCDEDNRIYDCVMNTTTGFFMGNCLVYPMAENIFPEGQCKGLAH